MHLVGLLRVDLRHLFEGARLLLARLRQRHDLAIALEQQLAGLGEPVLDLRQAVHDRLLEHAPRVLVLLQRRALARNLALQLADHRVAAVELDHLPRGGLGGLFGLGLELVDADGRLGAQPVLVGAYLRLGERHGALQHLGGETGDAAPIQRGDEQRQQGRREEAQRREHDHLDRDHACVLDCATSRNAHTSLARPAKPSATHYPTSELRPQCFHPVRV